MRLLIIIATLISLAVGQFDTFIWAHRGASGYEVDNTIESFEMAIGMGADGLESDVGKTKDGVIVLFHDHRILFQGEKKFLSKLTLEEVKSVDLGNGRRIPTVEEAFRHFKFRTNNYGKEITFCLDLHKLEIGLDVIEVAENLNMAHRVELTPSDDSPLFFHYCKKYREKSKDIVLVDSAHFTVTWIKVIGRLMFYQNYDKFQELAFKAINMNTKHASDEYIKEIRDHGLKMYVWNCHDEESLTKYFTKRVDAIYSNYPDMAAKIRNEIQGGQETDFMLVRN